MVNWLKKQGILCLQMPDSSRLLPMPQCRSIVWPATIFVHLNGTSRKTQNLKLIPNEEIVITLEHILPQNSTWDNWPNIEQELAAAVHKRIGNMVLLKAAPNSTLGMRLLRIRNGNTPSQHTS